MVGDSAGWTFDQPIDSDEWTANKAFKDTLSELLHFSVLSLSP